MRALQSCKKRESLVLSRLALEKSCQDLSKKIDKTAQLANVEDQASLQALLEKLDQNSRSSERRKMKLEQKNVFITGSSRGIGLAIAHKFASLGANVVLNSRGEISEELLDEFKPYGVKVLAISGDVSDFTDAKRMVDQAIEELGSVDVLVNNAGITQDTLHAEDDRR